MNPNFIPPKRKTKVVFVQLVEPWAEKANGKMDGTKVIGSRSKEVETRLPNQ